MSVCYSSRRRRANQHTGLFFRSPKAVPFETSRRRTSSGARRFEKRARAAVYRFTYFSNRNKKYSRVTFLNRAKEAPKRRAPRCVLTKHRKRARHCSARWTKVAFVKTCVPIFLPREHDAGVASVAQQRLDGGRKKIIKHGNEPSGRESFNPPRLSVPLFDSTGRAGKLQVCFSSFDAVAIPLNCWK